MDLPLATTVRQYWEAAMSRLGGEADFSRMYEFVNGKKGLKTLAARLGRGRAARPQYHTDQYRGPGREQAEWPSSLTRRPESSSRGSRGARRPPS
ncbi:MAG: hypothetical protein ACREJI_08435 [Candidatus Methylomirabilales bacterium]